MSKATDLAATINKTLGREALHMGSDPMYVTSYIPTGLLPMDILLQGGLPRGRFVECYGDFSSLKTYIGLCAAREAQRQGGVASMIDTEHTFDPAWAELIGINTKELILWPDLNDQDTHTGEEAIDTAQALIIGKADLLIFDSIAATLPQKEGNKRLHGENIAPGSQANLMSAACRRLTASNNKTAVFWINQLRQQIGVTFGNPEITSGGKAMAYYASHRIRMQKTGKITEDERIFVGDKWQDTKVQVGQRYKAEVTKSKLSKPFRDVWFDWDLRTGAIDLVGFLISQGVEAGVVDAPRTKGGSKWSFDGKTVTGREKFKEMVIADRGVQAAIESEVRAYHGLPPGKSYLGPEVEGQRRSRSRGPSAAAKKTVAPRKGALPKNAAQGRTPTAEPTSLRTTRVRIPKS